MNTPNNHNNPDTYFNGLGEQQPTPAQQPHSGLGAESGRSEQTFSNTYADTHNQRMQSDALSEADAPALTAPVDRSVNKKALMFLGALSLGIVGAAAWGISKLSSEDTPNQAPEQTVMIPEAPNQTNIPAPIPVDPTAKPIEVVPAQPAPMTPQPVSNVQVNNAPMQDPIIDLRRNSGKLVQAVAQQNGGDDDPNQGVNVRYLPNRDKMLVRGTYIRCVLETRIVTDIAGFTSCVITEPVYSVNGRTLLIPKGSKISGKYGSSSPVFPRVSVVWERILTPSGFDITLKSPGIDNQGGSGHPGEMTTHFAQRFANALLVSLISDAFTYAAAEYSNVQQTTTTSTSTTTSTVEPKSASTMEKAAINELERYGSRPNTVWINQGSVVTIYTARDIDFSGISIQ